MIWVPTTLLYLFTQEVRSLHAINILEFAHEHPFVFNWVPTYCSSVSTPASTTNVRGNWKTRFVYEYVDSVAPSRAFQLSESVCSDADVPMTLTGTTMEAVAASLLWIIGGSRLCRVDLSLRLVNETHHLRLRDTV